ncbi:hypothetical protein [Novosphingobium sp. BW1]|uniref:hypothetical protein n=1 Tax=Novosphingobium sp. BW1 TaxID=2592621 RepID=UPI001396A173
MVGRARVAALEALEIAQPVRDAKVQHIGEEARQRLVIGRMQLIFTGTPCQRYRACLSRGATLAEISKDRPSGERKRRLRVRRARCARAAGVERVHRVGNLGVAAALAKGEDVGRVAFVGKVDLVVLETVAGRVEVLRTAMDERGGARQPLEAHLHTFDQGLGDVAGVKGVVAIVVASAMPLWTSWLPLAALIAMAASCWVSARRCAVTMMALSPKVSPVPCAAAVIWPRAGCANASFASPGSLRLSPD